MKIKLFIIIISIITLITSCKKDEIQKSDTIQIPDTLSYFNAKLNGELYNPDSTIAFITKSGNDWRMRIVSYKDSNHLEITLFKNLKRDSLNTFVLGNYTFTSDTSLNNANINYLYKSKSGLIRAHFLASNFTISLNKQDTTKKIISATFSGKLKRPDSNQTDTLIVTEGIFKNIRYN
ncbi:MAG: hypothetical protein ACK44D_03755 [Bacteroidia bacterium]